MDRGTDGAEAGTAAHRPDAVACGVVLALGAALAVEEAVQALVALRHRGVGHHAAQRRQALLGVPVRGCGGGRALLRGC